jgi:hypothetical protein
MGTCAFRLAPTLIAVRACLFPQTTHTCVCVCVCAGYPLRPELMESTFLLHSATGDPSLLAVGAALHQRLADKNRVACGYASVGDVTTGQLEVRREVGLAGWGPPEVWVGGGWQAGASSTGRRGAVGVYSSCPPHLHHTLGCRWCVALPVCVE